MKMVDCQGLAGHGVILGGVQAGFTVQHRTALPGGFGNEIVNANRHLLGDFEVETGTDEEWTPFECSYLAGVPPCSGFSLLNTAAASAKKKGRAVTKNARGPESAINQCQGALVRYASKCRGEDGLQGPEIVVFESVQGAFKQGHELMRHYWDLLKSATGQPYQLTHFLHDVAGLGGPQRRRRYFWIAHRVPFGIEMPKLERITTIEDAIGDLRDLEIQWEPQSPKRPASEWAKEEGIAVAGGVIDSHVTGTGRHFNDMEELLDIWEPGENHEKVLRKLVASGGMHRWWNPEKDGPGAFMGPRRLEWHKPGYVLTGGAICDFIHPSERRSITVREAARLMQIPDAWTFAVARHAGQASSWIGKNCTAGAGRFMATWARQAILGEPGTMTGEEVEPNEFVINTTNDHTKQLKEQIRQAEEGALV